MSVSSEAVGDVSQLAVESKQWFYRPKSGGPYGNSNGETYENAWHLAGYAYRKVGAVNWALILPGDTLYVGGTHDVGYEDNVIQPPMSGTLEKSIVIDGNMPKFEGAINANDFDPGIYVGVGLLVSNGWAGPDAFGAWSKSFNVASRAFERIGGGDLVRLIKQSVLPDETWLAGSFYQSGSGETLYYKPTSGNPNDADHYYYTEGNEPVRIKDVNYITVRNLEVVGANRGIEVSNAQGINLENNHLYWHSNTAIRVGSNSDSGTLIGNDIHDSANGVYFISTQTVNNSDNWHIAYNEVYNIDQFGYYGHQDSHALGFQGGNDHVIEYNHLHHAAGVALIFFTYNNFDQETKNNTIRFNFIHDIENFSDSAAIDDAFWFGNINEVNPSLDAVQDNVFHHNVILNIKGIGIRTKSWVSNTGPNWSFANNLVSNANVSFAWHEGSNGDVGFTFENNISLNPVTQHLDQLSYSSSDIRTGVVMRNNLYWPDGDVTKPGFEWNGVLQQTLSDWQDVSTLGANSVALDPQMVAPTTGDFRWNAQPSTLLGLGDYSLALSTSPAVNGAVAVPFTTNDIEGFILSNPSDIGPYQFHDTDGDQLSDALEALLGTDLLLADTDSDGVSDYDELNYGGYATTYNVGVDLNPLLADTDGDGISDGDEIVTNSDPLDGASFPLLADINDDGVVNAADVLLVVRIVLGSYTPTAAEAVRADIAPYNGNTPNPDGLINLGDMLVIMRTMQGSI
ncbi:MAG TPA: hypothetical protein EYN61_03925 [Chromatiaceae bacterium]|nr:hypothetical protein [Chromatiaceae bacterium]